MIKFRKRNELFTRHSLNNTGIVDSELATHFGASPESFNYFLLSKPDKELTYTQVMSLIDSYNRKCKVKFIHILKKETSADWLELIVPNDDRKPVAVILPEPNTKAGLIRLSFYTKNGPINHAIYPSKLAAIEAALKSGYIKVKEGALDSIVGTNDWHRGLYICQWAEEQVYPYDAIMAAEVGSEVYDLWHDFIVEHKDKAA
ncbi:MAG: hypothetical protein HRU38_06830 [Saccharospirillaceae bacterium]|nr:hypothetical protein [Saccharospirillaceae bacterium]